MTESVAYMSENGVLFKEMPPNPMFELTPLYKLRDVSDKEIEELANFIFLQILFLLSYSLSISNPSLLNSALGSASLPRKFWYNFEGCSLPPLDKIQS